MAEYDGPGQMDALENLRDEKPIIRLEEAWVMSLGDEGHSQLQSST
jgi:hypothetical protein